jgi:hypothetical protein
MSFRETVSEHIVTPALAKAGMSADMNSVSHEIEGVIVAYDPTTNRFGFRPTELGRSLVAPEVLDSMFPMLKKKHEVGEMGNQIGERATLVLRGRLGIRGAYLKSTYSAEGRGAYEHESIGYEPLCPGDV